MSLFSSRRWLSPVSTRHAATILLFHCYCTGIIDASVFANYSVFVAMQTGNTIILALSTTQSLPHNQPYAYLLTLVSICSFLLGALLTAHVSYAFMPLRRVTLATNLLLQGLLIATSAILISIPGLIPEDNEGLRVATTLGNPLIVAVIPMLAFESGMQITTSKLMGVDEIPVNVMTSLFAGLMSDPGLFKWRTDNKNNWGWFTGNFRRSRRLAALIMTFSGALCGAFILAKGPGIILCLWLASGIKITVAIAAGIFMGEGEVEDKASKVKELG